MLKKPFQSSPRASLSLLALYSSASVWNLCLAMMQVLVPLYALSLGFSALRIGSLVAVPALAHVMIRFMGGAFADRFGERRVLQGCYVLLILAAVVLLWAEDFATLLIAQATANLSQASFWISSQSLVSQLPGSNMGKKLGRLTACNYGGNLIGLNLGGLCAALLGYAGSFLALTVLTLVCFLLGLALPDVDPKPSHRTVWQITSGIGRFLRYPQVWLVISVSYAAALPVSLTVSVYPIYLSELGYGEQWIGTALSFRAMGPVLIGLALGSLITAARRKGLYALGMSALGLSLVGSGLTERILLIGFCIGVLGAAGGMLDLLYQVLASEMSNAGDRSMAMASMGLGWNLSFLSIPVMVTWLVEVQGFQFALLSTGAVSLLAALGTPMWHRLLEPVRETSRMVSLPTGQG